ncbi:hypothetical protein BCV69DRAFT_282030 [Microstroma glucosiphilum]|uniref:Dolichyl-phosphate-mannose--protein mannosyltransferase n=1 Tax=Pseudomicrostroma glucosiphilum TaxID=1684307 RepID=A0A316U8X3_9BASI|nr:hypothetical protein BCV69DRAFT_282030 [Pseudomicrostroma glucosiphilum]PWN21294.1 hypothetical protein BCV69DRAFT_282030 [Pseudomicrostroma glucosiphilum]
MAPSIQPQAAVRSRKAKAGAPHDHVSDEERRMAMKNGTYFGEDEDPDSKFRSSAVPVSESKHGLTWKEDGTIILAIALIGAALRFWQIGYPAQVVFDEVHFGKFAAYYLRREYYFDVHPPFAKMLNALAGYLAGFKGDFEFENITDKYEPAGVPYIKMRALPALLGTAKTPLVYMIMRETGHARIAALLSAGLVLFDTAQTLQDRLILLDAALCLFMILAVYSYIKFYKQRYNEFSFRWWAWMIATGVNLSLTMSCKMVGLLTFLTVGTAVLVDLWKLLDINRGLTMRRVAKHFFARALGLIVIPAIVYMFWFWVHFKILKHSGQGDSFMSSEFQETLEGNPMLAQAKTIHYGDEISMRHKGTGAFLHSHPDKYPLKYDDGRISSQGQQVTGYPHNDTNNIWKVVPTIALPEEDGDGKIVRNNHVVRFLHVNTQSYLLTHDVASPLMSTNEEFTTVPIDDDTRYNDTLFELQISGKSKTSTAPWQSKSSWFKLIHVPTRVALWTYPEPLLPEWAFKQQEVNGNKNVNDKTNLWYVEDVMPDQDASDYEERSAPAAPRKVVHMSFFKKFVELQLQMLQQNAGLTASHPYASSPINWPFDLSGISFWTENDEQRQIYLIGNVVSWWTAILLISVYVGIMGADILARRRGLRPITADVRRRMSSGVGFFIVGWIFHYLPFFSMNRQLFLHHYLPAQICGCMVAGGVFQFIAVEEVATPLSRPGPGLASSAKSSNETRYNARGELLSLPRPATKVVVPLAANFVAAALLGATIAMFIYLSPFVYGLPLTVEQVAARKLLSTWSLHFMPSTSDT